MKEYSRPLLVEWEGSASGLRLSLATMLLFPASLSPRTMREAGGRLPADRDWTSAKIADLFKAQDHFQRFWGQKTHENCR